MSEPTGSLEPSEPAFKGRESIWKRSKRVLGSSHFAFLKENGGDPSLDKTSPKSDAGSPGKPTVSKRREQVRRAQKTHRQRTENYIKALEKEVIRLKAVEVENSKEIKFLRSELSRFQGSTTSSGNLESPSFLSDDLQSPYQLASNDYTATDWNMTLTGQSGSFLLRADPTTMAAGLPSTKVQNSHTSHKAPSPDHNRRYWVDLAQTNPLANEQNALNFVLALEQPCMAHLEQHGTNPDAPDGHTLTASETIMRQAPNQFATQKPWMADTTGVMKLFSLSSQLELDTEVTPIQAWNLIWQHENARHLNAERLEALTNELKKLVVCYGFGAVLDDRKCSYVIEKTLSF